MAQATVKTVQYLDPRIEPQPDPVYDYVIGPTQNQYYKIPASGLSDSNITFNNLTTLGIDRAYLDTFELELEVEITFTVPASGATLNQALRPKPYEWTFDSFPFNKCCDEARVNINGGAFFSQPMSYIRAKERYMNQYELSRCYENICPVHRAICQTESGKNYNATLSDADAMVLNRPFGYIHDPRTAATAATDFKFGRGVPTRLGAGMFNFGQSEEGLRGGFNNSIVVSGGKRMNGANQVGWNNYYADEANHVTKVKCRWREPIFVSPFSSRYDANYGRPLYNITSMDFSFTMQNLGNMIRVANLANEPITGYTITISKAQLCYQVMTIPPILNKPLTTLVPYRRFVPYITDYNQQLGVQPGQGIPVNGDKITISSGVYTLNEMPVAIWVFCAPSRSVLQTNEADSFGASAVDGGVNYSGNWDTNKLFAYIKKINISMANTTQILATAEVADLYRIAKANGCEDSFWSWGGDESLSWDYTMDGQTSGGNALARYPTPMYYGAGSVLRLKPGVDLIVPDQPLIPAANADNMVFQCTAEFQVPPHSAANNKYSLWLLFEYVGVAAISPGQCEITMNPLGSGDIMAVSPVMSATSESTEGKLEGSGFWDSVKRAARIATQLADDGIISTILKRIPGAEGAADWAKKHGLGEPACKRGRGGATPGGAVIGKGLSDWACKR